jgi:hypothetical protein
VTDVASGRTRARSLLGDPLAALVTLVASVLLSFASTGLTPGGMRRPTLNGDRFFYYGLDRGLIDHGWYLHNDALGYPYGQDLRRFPVFDQTHLLILKVLGLGSSDPILVTNAYFLLGFPLAGLAALLFLRVIGVRTWLAAPLAVSYAVLPWHVERAQHLFLASYWVVPLGMTLVWLVGSGRWDTWLPTLDPRRRRLVTIAGSVTGIVVALGGIYYAFMLCALILLALALRGWSSRAWRGPSMWLVGTLVGTTFVALVIARLAEHAATGPDDSGAGFLRNEEGGERYAGRIAHLLLPWREAPLVGGARDFYDSHRALILPESTSFSILAAAGTWLLLGLAVQLLLTRFHNRPVRDPDSPLPWLAGTTIVLVLVYTTTGLGSMVSQVVPELRGWSRFSIFIALTSTAAVGLVLQDLLARVRWRPTVVTAAVAVLLSGLVVVDQGQESGDLAPAALNDRLQASRAATAQVDRAIDPDDCAVAQWPYRAFPEVAPAPPLRTYDEEITYIAGWDRPLSYGAVKGSIAGDWGGLLDQSSAEHLVSQLASADFCVLEVLEDVVRTPEQEELEQDLPFVLGIPVAADRLNHRRYYDLRGIRARLDALGPDAVRALRDGALRPVQATFDEKSSLLRGLPGSRSTIEITEGRSVLRVTNSSDERRSITLTLRVTASGVRAGDTATAFVADRVVGVGTDPAEVTLTFDLDGHGTRRFDVRDARTSDGRPVTLTFSEPQLAYARGPFLEPPAPAQPR